MAVRNPLYWDTGSSSIKTMTTGEVANIVSQVSYLYSLNPSVTLSVVASGGSLGSISDTRLQAGTYVTRAGDGVAGDAGAGEYYPETSTPEPTMVTTNYSRIDETVATLTEPTSGTEGSYPVYYYNNGIRPFSETDVYDTFIDPAITALTTGSTTAAQAGTYRIHTATTLTGHTLVSTTPVFVDTRADTSLYTADGIPETLDQPQTITSFYLFKIDGSATSYIKPLRITASNNNLQVFSNTLFDALLQNHVRYAAAASSGMTIRYNINGTGNNRGSGMTDTKLNGSGNYQTLFGGVDDYRSQEFPDGTPITENTYYLKINKS